MRITDVRTRVPLAGGEHEFTIFGFRELLENNALDCTQFDTNRVGGISQFMAALPGRHDPRGLGLLSTKNR
jgi:L-alanine-DL-glutamate epimerase-like enolase superfamily enzyme